MGNVVIGVEPDPTSTEANSLKFKVAELQSQVVKARVPEYVGEFCLNSWVA